LVHDRRDVKGKLYGRYWAVKALQWYQNKRLQKNASTEEEETEQITTARFQKILAR
jgi:hypothetical protein